MVSFTYGEATLVQNCHTGVASPTLPGSRCSQCSRPVWQQWLCAGQRHRDKRERQQVMVPVQLRQRVDVARESKLCLTGVVVKRNLWSVRPKVNASPRIPKGQSLFARGHIKAHEQLAHCVDVKDVCYVSESSWLAELVLTWKKQRWNDFTQTPQTGISRQSQILI